jgi:hypothetical protein
MYFGVMFTSTTLGGVMVEVGNRFKASGRLTSQRIGMFKLADLTGGPLGGWLSNFHFSVPACLCAGLHLALIPFLMRYLPPEEPSKLDRGPWVEVARQGKTLIGNRTLLGAAAMIILLAASPGMGTPLLFYQTDVLHFSKTFIGNLGFVGAAAGMIAAAVYFPVCRRFKLSNVVAVGIIIHTLGGLCFLFYRSWETAIIVTAISSVTSTMVMLPVYDIAIRATPKGSEAIGYAVMMSVWNLTNAWADWLGSFLWQRLKDSAFAATMGTPIGPLILIDAISTIIVIVAVPFMPKALSAKESDVAK